MRTKDTYDGTGRWELRHNGVLKHKGDYTSCAAKLLRLQSASIEWALKYESWTITNPLTKSLL